MGAGGSNEYLRNQVMTASQEQLQLMLYDGAIRYARLGKQAILDKDIEASFNHLTRAQRIVLEMLNGLRPEINPELCNRMAGLYNFIYRRLVDGSVNRDTKVIDEALDILEYQRETWAMLLKKLNEGNAEKQAPQNAPASQAPEHVESFSVEG